MQYSNKRSNVLCLKRFRKRTLFFLVAQNNEATIKFAQNSQNFVSILADVCADVIVSRMSPKLLRT